MLPERDEFRIDTKTIVYKKDKVQVVFVSEVTTDQAVIEEAWKVIDEQFHPTRLLGIKEDTRKVATPDGEMTDPILLWKAEWDSSLTDDLPIPPYWLVEHRNN